MPWHLAHALVAHALVAHVLVAHVLVAHALVAHGCRLLHLLLGQGIFLTLSDIVVLFLGNICLLDMHYVEVDLGLPCCCSDLIVFEGTLEIRRVLDKFWTNDPILCGTWDMKVAFNLGEEEEEGACNVFVWRGGGETARSLVTSQNY